MARQILTRHDKATGQRLFDYYTRQVPDPKGKYLRISPDGTQHRYSVTMVVTKRYQVI